MSILFDDASSESLSVTAAPITAYPFSIGGWFKTDDTGATGAILGISDISEIAVYQELVIDGSSQKLLALSRNGSTGSAATTTTISANTWYHGLAVFTSATSRAVYLNGGGKGTDTSNITFGGGTDTLTVGAVFRSIGNIHFFSGRLDNVAIWDIALDDTDAVVLAARISPKLVRPSGLVFYRRLLALTEAEEIGGLTLTQNNTPTDDGDHPGLYYPSRPRLFVPPAAAGVTTRRYSLSLTGVG